MALFGYYTGDPVMDAERYQRDLDAADERERHARRIKCTATLWITIEHATPSEALLAASERFTEMFKDADDSDFRCTED